MLQRLLRPRSVAVIGGGRWCENVIAENVRIGFDGPIWPVHPTRDRVAGLPAFASVADLPEAPDAAFVGVNRAASVEVVAALARRDSGGAVCFASGFREAQAELSDGADLQSALVAAASRMPILGPNCYGFINALDGAALWPDHHGMAPCDTGVALITQSSNLAINLTMQDGGLPIAYTVTAGNQAQTGMAAIGMALLEDARVTALGLHIEGIGDLDAFVRLATHARDLGKPIVALKVGASDQAQQAMISHTASLAGSDAGAAALFQRLGIGRTSSPAIFLETLKLAHVTGGIGSGRIASMSCSGGEAGLMADLGQAAGLHYPPLTGPQIQGLRAALGPKVALSNPLDYHTYIWGDTQAMAATFAAMTADPGLAIGCVVLDYPKAERMPAPQWDQVIDAMILARGAVPLAVMASLPGNLPTEVAKRCIAHGIVPFTGMAEGLAAIAAAAMTRPGTDPQVLRPGRTGPARTLSEVAAKAALAQHGLSVPRHRNTTAAKAADDAEAVGFPIVLKALGIAHKTEAGAVALNLTDRVAVVLAAQAMHGPDLLAEQMIGGAVAELLIGVLADPAHGFVLTLGAGGTLTEIMADSASLLLPAPRDEVHAALMSLRIAPLLRGYRGAPAADIDSILDAVQSMQDYVAANRLRLQEVEVNPLLCLPRGAVAADALIRIDGASMTDPLLVTRRGRCWK